MVLDSKKLSKIRNKLFLLFYYFPICVIRSHLVCIWIGKPRLYMCVCVLYNYNFISLFANIPYTYIN